jgi:gamma-glutamyl hercynylcysteine S-oxide synthase
MASPPATSSEPTIADALALTRARTLALVESVSDDDLERVHSTLMSPLVWDLGHIAAFEDLWLAHRYGGRQLLRDELMDVYDAFETPREGRGKLPFLRPVPAREFMQEVRERVLSVLDEQGPGDGLYWELVLRHELQHSETMAQALCLARLPGYSLDPVHELVGTGPGAGDRTGLRLTGLERVTVPAGECHLGAGPDGFAYDNERPAFTTFVDAFELGRAPISNGEFLEFVRAGGYSRPDWWSRDGWAWRSSEAIERPGGWTESLDGEWRAEGLVELDPWAPVVHVSWWEAEAFCNSHGLRLPSEFEWEKACSLEADTGRQVWAVPPAANLGFVSDGPQPVSPLDTSPSGCLGMVGDVWEWTASHFDGYEGFVAHPYREYSEVFFGTDYRVLRGGSWATSPRVAGATFRNWDYPQRRQIFSGFRVAR